HGELPMIYRHTVHLLRSLVLGNSVPFSNKGSKFTMQRLIIVSNRLPISVSKDEEGLHFSESIGGLATGLGSFVENSESLWIGWPGLTVDELTEEERKQIEDHLRAKNYEPIFLSQAQVDNFYHGFCNDAIWPLFHYFHLYTRFDESYWQAYKEV